MSIRPFFIPLSLVFHATVYSQWSADFSTPSWSRDWLGDTTSFQVDQGRLRSFSTQTNDTFYISTPSMGNEAEKWELEVELNLRTSSLNYVEFHLAATDPNLPLASHSLFLKIGGTKDDLRLYHRKPSQTDLIFDGPDGITEKSHFWLEIKHYNDSLEIWLINDPLDLPDKLGTIPFPQLTVQSYSGLLVRQSSSSFHQRHYFDKLYIGPSRPWPSPQENKRGRLPTEADLTFSEILFDPLPGGCDFIEIYNRGEDTLLLDSLFLTSVEWGSRMDPIPIGSTPHPLLPGQFLLLCKDSSLLQRDHHIRPGALVLDMPLPKMPNDSGILLLTNGSGEVLDSLFYHYRFHFPLLVDTEGTSLEKICLTNPSNDSNLWHSTASVAGFSTPGGPNSHQNECHSIAYDLSFDRPSFSPNGDGLADLLILSYSFPLSNFIINGWVYDSDGRLRRHWLNNTTLPQSGTLTFNGIDDRGWLLPTGHYILFIQANHPEQGVIRKKLIFCLDTGTF